MSEAEEHWGQNHCDQEKAPDVRVAEGEVVAETAAAVLVDLEDEDDIWIPKSQLGDDNELNSKGDTGTLVVTHWLAQKRGWA